jgi:glycosyltransferase involved in cell wall biosynthesis
MSKLLLIGPLSNKNDETNIGGVTILFELLLSEVRRKNIEFDVIDTLKDNYPNAAFAFFSSAFKLMVRFRKYDYISLQASNNSLVLLGPIMVLLSKIYNKKTSMRKFAGNLDVVYEKSNFFKKMLIRYVLKNTDINFFETKYLMDYFYKFNSNTYWFPNVRQQMLIPEMPRKFSKRFIYIGTINKEKGIDEIIEIIGQLDDDYTLDLYGPIMESKYAEIQFEESKVNYCGHLHPDSVPMVLNTYDVLILPSYREGYPGVVIEAFSLGIPVIATKLQGIMEMVQDGINGLLVNVKDSSQLKYAIESINNEKYVVLSENALKSFSNFNSEEQTNLFLKRIGIEI